MTLADDPSLTRLLEHLAHTAAAARRRVFELGGQTADEALVALAFRVVRRTDERRVAKPAGPVIDLAEARAARSPTSPNYVLALLSDDAARRIIGRAQREHGEANDATKALVLASAITLGLDALDAS